jgi:hypothetical protein
LFDFDKKESFSKKEELSFCFLQKSITFEAQTTKKQSL